MKAATWRGGRRFTVDTVPDPAPGPGEVVVAVDTVGICGSEVHATQGLFPIDAPAILGHEFSGVVVEAGEGVPASRIGEGVACNLSPHCLECEECLSGRWSRCVNGRRVPGAFAERVALPASCAVPVPAGLPLEYAALTEPASCCLSGMRMFDMPDDAVVLVIGGGVMGLFSLAFAKARGAAVAIMSEPVAARRAMASQLGADILHDPAAQDLKAVVDEATGGRGVHVAVEAVGKPELVARCVELTRPRGTVLLIGVNPPGSTLSSDLYDFHFREIVLRGAFGRGDAFELTLNQLPSLKLDGIITGRYTLDELPEAFATATEARGVKTVVKPNQ